MSDELSVPNPKDYVKLGDDILQFFAYEHLRDDLQKISRPFHAFATELVRVLPNCPERTVCLRKLLEAKDSAVRAKLWKPAN